MLYRTMNKANFKQASRKFRMYVLTMELPTSYFLLTLKSIITCSFLALLLQHLSSSYQNTAANYFSIISTAGIP